MKSRLEEIDVAAMLSLIEQESLDLGDNDSLLQECQKLEAIGFATDRDLQQTCQMYEGKLSKFKEVLGRKQALFIELIHSVE